MRVLVIDNYDSFVFNLVQYLGQLGVECEVRRNDEIDVAEVGPARRGRRPALPRAGQPGPRRHLPGRHPGVRRQAADLRRLPRPPGDRRGVRGDRDPRPRAAARQDLRGTAPPVGRARRPARPVHRHPVPLAGRAARDAARRDRGDRLDRVRRGDGDAAPDAADRGRAVPPGVGAHPGRAPDAGQLAGRLRSPGGPGAGTRAGRRGRGPPPWPPSPPPEPRRDVRAGHRIRGPGQPRSAFWIAGSAGERTAGGRPRTASHAALPLAK